MTGFPARVLLAVIEFYRQGVSPLLGPRCRFTPTCSEYALEAVHLHGAGRGSWLAVRRVLKCAPWHRGGIDLVPDVPHVPAAGGSTDTGTAQHAHSSDTGTAPALADRPVEAPRPTRRRTPQQEARVA